jgi:hypothetical protein
MDEIVTGASEMTDEPDEAPDIPKRPQGPADAIESNGGAANAFDLIGEQWVRRQDKDIVALSDDSFTQAEDNFRSPSIFRVAEEMTDPAHFGDPSVVDR